MVSHCTQGCFVHFSENIKAEPSARESSIFVLEELVAQWVFPQ